MKYKYKKVVADAGYESEENYPFLEKNGQIAFIIPASYEVSKTRKYQNDIGRKKLGQTAKCLHAPFRLDRLDQVVQGMEGKGIHRVFLAGGDEHDAGFRGDFLQRPRDVHAVFTGHIDIQKCNIKERLFSRRL